MCDVLEVVNVELKSPNRNTPKKELTIRLDVRLLSVIVTHLQCYYLWYNVAARQFVTIVYY